MPDTEKSFKQTPAEERRGARILLIALLVFFGLLALLIGSEVLRR